MFFVQTFSNCTVQYICINVKTGLYIYILLEHEEAKVTFRVLISNFYYSGQSKSLTFEEGTKAGNAGADGGSDEDKNKKVPEDCCPALMHKW